MDKWDEILDVVKGIADRMATKVELQEGLTSLDTKIDGVEARLTQKLDSLSNRLDAETDARSALGLRVGTLEKKVSAR